MQGIHNLPIVIVFWSLPATVSNPPFALLIVSFRVWVLFYAVLNIDMTVKIMLFTSSIFFPRLILTRHFWSDAQRKKYFQLDVQRSLANSSLPGLLGNVSVVAISFGVQVDQIMKPCWDEGEVLFAHATAGFLTRKGSHLMVSLCHFDRM